MDFAKRKSPRLKSYDYSTPGYYFVTMCTHEKRKILGSVVSSSQKVSNEIVGASHESPEIRLTAQGEIVDEIIRNIPVRFNVIVDKYVIMPNHIHLILVLKENEALRAIRESPLRHREMLDMVVGYIKMNASKKIHNEVIHGKVWQRSYHDHIIRGEKDYRKIWEYIDTNPARWSDDCFYL